MKSRARHRERGELDEERLRNLGQKTYRLLRFMDVLGVVLHHRFRLAHQSPFEEMTGSWIGCR